MIGLLFYGTQWGEWCKETVHHSQWMLMYKTTHTAKGYRHNSITIVEFINKIKAESSK
jgi:hypothetical protein